MTAVLLDLDNTLLLEDEATDCALRRTSELAAQRTGGDPAAILAAAAGTADELFRAADAFRYADEMGISWGEALWGDFSGGAAGLAALRAFVPAYRRAVWGTAVGAAANGDALAGELADAFARERRALRPVDPAAGAVLDALAIGHRLALVTNGAPAVQREKLAATPFGPRFQAIVISCEVGAGKPDPRIFQEALAALGAAPADAVVVGDSLPRDIAGARRAGLRSVWLDRGGPPASGSAVPDARITALRDLPAALASLPRAGALPRLA